MTERGAARKLLQEIQVSFGKAVVSCVMTCAGAEQDRRQRSFAEGHHEGLRGPFVYAELQLVCPSAGGGANENNIMDKDNLLAQFQAITNTSIDQANFYLESSQWDLNVQPPIYVCSYSFGFNRPRW